MLRRVKTVDRLVYEIERGLVNVDYVGVEGRYCDISETVKLVGLRELSDEVCNGSRGEKSVRRRYKSCDGKG